MTKKAALQGAPLKCSQGLSPSKLLLRPGVTTAGGKSVGTVMAFLPIVNIPAFGMCQSLANPQVAAATAAAQGALTPQPCIPVIAAPWTPGAVASTAAGEPLLTEDSTCRCQWGGRISIGASGARLTTR